MAVDLKNHTGLNPEYFVQMEQRKEAIIWNRSLPRFTPDGIPLRPVPVPPQPNKYIPHIGAKQRAKAIRLETIKANG